MLTKLFKQEWFATTKVLLPVNLLLVAVTLFGCFVMKFFPFNSKNMIAQSFSISALMLYFLAVFGLSCAAYIFIIVRFYKTMYSDEGYLTHTLPVTVHTLIIGKGLAATIWFFITYSLLMVSIAVLTIMPLSPADINKLYQDFFTELETYNLLGFVWMFPMLLITSSIYAFLNVTASLSIGQLFTKHKIIGSILAYCGIYTITQIGSLILISINGYFNYISPDSLPPGQDFTDFIYAIFGLSMGFSIVLCVVFYVITWQLTSKKLNLD